jgi:4-hydroxybenzoate polyprenyltransferase
LLAVQAVPSAHDLLWITIAMVGARSLAMGLNRLIDAELDARNPRNRFA